MRKDRKDGKYLKPTDAIHGIMPYLMDKRIEAEVNSYQTLDLTNLIEWVDIKNQKLDFKMTYFQALSAVFAKVLYNRPDLNRFVQGNRMYMRKDVSIAFVAKDKMTDKAEEKMIVLKVNAHDNAVKLARKESIDIFQTRKQGTNDIDKFLKMVTKCPRFIMRILMRTFKWLDYHGWVPKSLQETDSNYATLLLSNLGSIKCTSCYHHLNNYGTNSIVITIGTIKTDKNKSFVDISSTLDERIADGFYFAKSIKLANYICEHPELLEDRFDKKIDIEF